MQIKKIVKDTVAEILDLDASSIEEDRDLRDYGTDSVALTLIAEKLSVSLGADVPPNLLIEHVTVGRIAAALTSSAPLLVAKPPRADEQAPLPSPGRAPAPLVARASRDSHVVERGDVSLRTRLCELVADTLGMPAADIDPSRDLRDYGADSVALTIMAERAGLLLGRPVLPNAIIEAGTVERLAAALGETARAVPAALASSTLADSPTGSVVHETPKPSPQVLVPSAPAAAPRAGVVSATGAEAVRSVVRAIVADTLAIAESELEDDRDLRDYGTDSVALTIIAEKLGAELGVDVPPNLIIEHGTIGRLVSAHARDASTSSAPDAEPATGTSPAKTSTRSVQALPHWVAVIGASCRFPGSPNLSAYWDNLAQGVDLVKPVPRERIDLERFYSPERGVRGKTYVRSAGMLGDVASFDPEFFELGADEATEMDPQQRIMLELCQEALDAAGYTRSELRGTQTGVFIGATESNYGRHLPGRAKFDGRRGVVNTVTNLIPGRISHFFDLHGPSMALYTACSSSLVSLNQACAALATQQCDFALAGGIELLLDEEWFVGFSSSLALSPRERCRVFDLDADGIAIGEGAGCLLLKRYEDALRDGDQIWGVIEGSALNNDGLTMGLTTPNLQAQVSLLRRALAHGRVDPATISYLEAHGAGTALGDPIEVKAASTVYGESTRKRGFCAIGSVKSNTGHLLTAAGAASLIKVLLSFRHRQLPGVLHLTQPHPRFEFENSPFTPVTKLTPWSPIDGVRRAAVSSFGFGGTNAHVILRDVATELGLRPTRAARPATRFQRQRCWLPDAQPEPDTLRALFASLRDGRFTPRLATPTNQH